MSETAQVKISDVRVAESALVKIDPPQAASVRVSLYGYLAAFFLAIFFTAFFVYLEQDLIAALLASFAFLALPLLAWRDRVSFDGANLQRTGTVPRLWNALNRQPQTLNVNDIEQVETQALRALKRGGNVFYRYHTSVRGKGKAFNFSSGGEGYRRMTRRLFVSLNADTLDNRSIELRDYLCEPKETSMKAAFAKLPSTEVLEESLNEFQTDDRTLRSKREPREATEKEIEKAEELRRLANELRLAGNLLQALEAFRRALHLNPLDAWLIFEFGRCLNSYANSERNEKLQKKARAAFRLAELRARHDGELLSRLGESYFQNGDWERARTVFQKSLTIAQESFRSVRGLAEVALREGKIAHVIHHFTIAAHFADTNALRRWAQGETEYFSRLNTDEKFMDAEIRRLKFLENTERGKKLALRIAVSSLLIIAFGVFFDGSIVNVGWACASVALLIWAGMLMTGNILSERSSLPE